MDKSCLSRMCLMARRALACIKKIKGGRVLRFLIMTLLLVLFGNVLLVRAPEKPLIVPASSVIQ